VVPRGKIGKICGPTWKDREDSWAYVERQGRFVGPRGRIGKICGPTWEDREDLWPQVGR